MVNVLRLALWPVVLAVGGATAALTITGGIADSPSLTATLGLVIGLSWCIAGLEEWRRRPGNRIGWLMVILGLAWFAGMLEYSSVSVLFTTGLFLKVLYLAVFAHVMLAFPTGRLESRFARFIVVAAYIDTTVVCAAGAVFNEVGCCPENLAAIPGHDMLSDRLGAVASGTGVALTVMGLCVLADRWRRATRPSRRVLGPVLWSGWATLAVSAISLLSETIGDDSGPIALASLIVFATVPFAFKVGLLRNRLARGAVADLVVALGAMPAPGELRDAVARALHDPSLELAYWLPEQQRYVDAAGQPVELPADGDPRVATFVENDGRRVGALIHDRSLRDDPELVGAVSAAARLALDNERLRAELRARVDELGASRARIVEATDAERRRVERNLHDGAQQRLVSVSLTLGLAESKITTDPATAQRMLEEARGGLRAALQELRELSQGIHPGILSERGLGPALQELAYGAPLPVRLAVANEQRLPEPVEAAAYYVVAEALTNVAKYASASAVTVSVDRRDGSAVVEVADDGVGGADAARGSGLRGLADRVEALGGTLDVESPRGAGTRLRAEIPCAS